MLPLTRLVPEAGDLTGDVDTRELNDNSCAGEAGIDLVAGDFNVDLGAGEANDVLGV